MDMSACRGDRSHSINTVETNDAERGDCGVQQRAFREPAQYRFAATDVRYLRRYRPRPARYTRARHAPLLATASLHRAPGPLSTSERTTVNATSSRTLWTANRFLSEKILRENSQQESGCSLENAFNYCLYINLNA